MIPKGKSKETHKNKPTQTATFNNIAQIPYCDVFQCKFYM